MKRVFKIAVGLMGVVLLAMVGVVEAGRMGKEAPEAILISEARPYGSPYAPELLLPSIGVQFKPFEGSNAVRFLGWSPRAEWMYFTVGRQADDTGQLPRGLYRLRLNPYRIERVLDAGVGYLTWAPDQEWMIGLGWFGESVFAEVFMMRSDGGGLTILTKDLDQRISTDISPNLLISADGRWLFFHVYDSRGSYIYRIDLATKDIRPLIEDATEPMALRLWLGNTDWLIIQTLQEGVGYFERIKPDGSLQEVISPTGAVLFDYGTNELCPRICYLKQHDLLIVQDDQGTYRGIQAATNDVLWEMEGRSLIAIDPNGEYLVFYTYPYTREQMRWDGTEVRSLGDFSQNSVFLRTYDGALLYSDNGLLYKLDVDTLTATPLASLHYGAIHIRPLQPATDEPQWLYFRSSTSSYQLTRVSLDGSRTETLVDTSDEVYFSIYSDGMPLEYEWQPALLLGLGFGSCGLFALTFAKRNR